MKIAVIAGTPVDTNMGIEFLEEQGHEGMAYPISQTPEEQSLLQVLYADKLREMVKDRIKDIKAKEIKNIFVYCNSLSAAVDMDSLAKEFNINIITPLQVYREMGEKFKTIGLLAANNQSTYGIEKVIQSSNPNAYIIGVGLLPLVKAIESKITPKEIMDTYSLDKIIEFMESFKCEGIILGCTHFPYVYKELKEKTSIPIIDPAMKMLGKLELE
ncbi:aspartate/glutamate racemase family protein [Clostridium malenominatum]|uniref:Aspartate/glutamate racemase family protein n=1 Tax=Clostridium malenominatum TaxID=1539 RepID=A0ABP3UBU4_9CLOT